MLCTAKRCHTINGEQIAANARDVCPHLVQHGAQLLYVRFASGVIYRRCALGEHGSHDDVCRTCHAGLVKQHICALERVAALLVASILLGQCLYLIYVAIVVELEARAKVLESQEVGVQTAASYLVAARFCHHRLAETSQQRTNHEHRAAQGRALAHEDIAAKIVEIEVCRAEHIVALAQFLYLHAHVAQQLYEVVDIKDVGNIAYPHLLCREQRRANHLQSLVLRSLRHDGAAKHVTTFDNE